MALSASQNAHRREQQALRASDLEREDDEREKREREAAAAKQEALFQTVEQMKLMVLGMEQRLATREEKLGKTIEKAERQSERFEVLRKDMGDIVVDG